MSVESHRYCPLFSRVRARPAVTVCVSGRLEARVAASRRILALAKRRDDVGHRLKLFESGDEERRSSGAGVQLQVRAAIHNVNGFFRIESRATRGHSIPHAPLPSAAGRAAAPYAAEGTPPHHRRVASVAGAGVLAMLLGIAHMRRALDSFAESHPNLILHRSGKQARGRASYSTACHFCMT